jgi:hypothetical protein
MNWAWGKEVQFRSDVLYGCVDDVLKIIVLSFEVFFVDELGDRAYALTLLCIHNLCRLHSLYAERVCRPRVVNS